MTGWIPPIAYASRKIIQVEVNYFVTEKEALARIYDVKKFKHHLLANKVMFITDHKILVDLVRKPDPHGLGSTLDIAITRV